MSFKNKSASTAPKTPMGLLPRRKFPDVMLHQKQMLTAYVNDMVGGGDVALQLPTGSGKTLVGLMIGE